MELSEFGILADENINPLLVEWLLAKNFDVIHVNEVNLGNTPDHVILAFACKHNRVVLTIDDDFGKLVFKDKQPFIGIIRLHPGHLLGNFHVPTLDAVLNANIIYQPPFLIVAEKRTDHVHIRYRTYTN